MTSLHRLCQPSHLSSNASSVTSCRGFGTQRRLMAAHHRHLAESTLKLWQQKPQNFVFIGGAKGRRKSLSVTSLRCSKADFVWRWKQKCFESVSFHSFFPNSFCIPISLREFLQFFPKVCFGNVYRISVIFWEKTKTKCTTYTNLHVVINLIYFTGNQICLFLYKIKPV